MRRGTGAGDCCWWKGMRSALLDLAIFCPPNVSYWISCCSASHWWYHSWQFDFSVIPKIFFWLCYTKKDINWSNGHLIINSARHSTASQQMIEGQIFWKLVENGAFQLVAFSGIIHYETSKRNYQNKTKMQTKLTKICVCLHAAVQIICRVCTVQSAAGWYRRPTCTV